MCLGGIVVGEVIEMCSLVAQQRLNVKQVFAHLHATGLRTSSCSLHSAHSAVRRERRIVNSMDVDVRDPVVTNLQSTER